MDEYWKALIQGLTPDSNSDAHLFWLAPVLLVVGLVVLAVVT